MSILRAIGLMSGTSLDGVDIALLETDGVQIERFGPTGYRPYLPAEQDLLHNAVTDAMALKNRNARPGVLGEAESFVTRAHAEAVENFISVNHIARDEVAIVGFHGQTVLHRPRDRLTVQIGSGSMLANMLAMPVAYDFRAADITEGGEGAPLVPVYHRALARTLNVMQPIIFVNIGGVANITYIDGDADPIAFDTGPGNAPIDDLVRARTGEKQDFDGNLAAHGKADQTIVAKVLNDPYFSRRPPKSLDRATFAKFPLETLSTENAAATVTAIVANSIAVGLEHLPKQPASVIVVGGGARNSTLIRMLQARIELPVKSADEIGWQGDAIEAQAFAYLAVRTLKGLPLTFPTTTGVGKPMRGGVIANP